jgi:TP901 family phage tail tape measure protein
MVGAGQNMAVAGAGIVYVFGKMVNAAAEFERKMDFFGAVQDTSVAKMEKLRVHTLQLAQDTIYSANEIADGYIELGKAGVNAQQIMAGIGEAMANLGAAGDIPLMESGQIITSTIQQFDLAARDAVSVTDLLAGAANASIADITDIGVSLKYVGGVANAVGLTFEDTTTAISLLAKAGIRGSTAGTSLRQMLVSLGGATGPATEALEELGIITRDGSNKFFTAEGKAKSLSEVFQILQNSTADLTQKQRLMYLRTIFNNRALSAASILTREGAKGFKAMNREMLKTTAADVASERLDNLSGDIEVLKGNIETFMIKGGTPFQEFLRDVVQKITELIQAFGELDPETQTMIIKWTALFGAGLLVMGMLSMLVGMLLRALVMIIRLKEAAGFLTRALGLTGGAATGLGGGLKKLLKVGGLIGLFYALGKALQYSYNKSEKSKRMMDSFAEGFKGGPTGAWGFSAWVSTYKQMWDEMNRMTGQKPREILATLENFGSDIGDFFEKLPSRVRSGIEAIPGIVQGAVDSTINFFRRLPTTVPQLVGQMVNSIIRFFQQLPTRISGIISTLVSTAARLFTSLGTRAISIVSSMVSRVILFFQKLPGRIGYLIGFMIGRVLGLMIKWVPRMFQLAQQVVGRVLGALASLPGRVVRLFARLVSGAIASFMGFVRRIPSMAASAASGLVDAVQNLPSTVANIFMDLVNRARNFLSKLPSMARNFGSDLSNNLYTAIVGLPGLVGGIFSNIVAAIKGKITDAFNSVRDFAKGMWEGFKDGLDINSPSIIEKQMFQMTKVMDEEVKKLGKKTMNVQRISRKLASTQFSIGGDAASGADQYKRLASMQAKNQNRARTLAAASSGLPRRNDAPNDRGPKRDRLVSGELDLTPNGRAFIRGVAEEVVEGSSDYDDSTDRMNF